MEDILEKLKGTDEASDYAFVKQVVACSEESPEFYEAFNAFVTLLSEKNKNEVLELIKD